MRAIAVSAVVLYHAGVGGAGFVGVDIFFVISGYLITSLLLREAEATGRIDLASFYARRARRILPAACLVILSVGVLANLFLGPVQLAAVLRSAAASLVFLANFHFQQVTGGYFDAAATELPLLHLWSLSVEEQFYLLWPAVVVVLARRGRKTLAMGVAVLAAMSLLLAQTWMSTDPEAAFFQMPARLWELAAGALIAASAVRGHANKLVLVVGLVLLAVGVAVKLPEFPGFGAMPAVLGASMVIAFVHHGGRNVFLASRPMVGLGLVSYSLYLWHWPLLALNDAIGLGDPSARSVAALCGLALLLSVATYRYVESPIRKLSTPPVATSAVGVAVLVGGAWLASWVAGIPDRNDPYPLATRAERDVPDRRCHSMGHEPVTEKCPPTSATRSAVLGDSMAYAWSPAVQRMDSKAAMYTRDACGPYLGYLPARPSKADHACQRFVEQAVHALERRPGLVVVLVALWVPDESRYEALERTLASLAPTAKHVILVGPTPQLRDRVPTCIRSGRPDACSVDRAEFDAHAGPILDRLRRAASPYGNVRVMDLSNEFCTAARCGPVKDGLPLYWDTHHVTLGKAQSIDFGLVATSR